MQKDLAQAIGVGEASIGDWESGDHPIRKNKLGKLCEALWLNDEEIFKFAKLVRPEFKDNWLKKKIKNDEMLFLSFPALDKSWLKAQEPKKREGLLLKAYRERRELELSELGAHIYKEESVISGWEHGRYPIDHNKLGALCVALQLDSEEIVYFVNLVNPDLKESWVREQVINHKLLHLSYPAFDAGWLGEQPLYKQAGLLLMTHREYNDQTRPQLAEKMKISEKMICNYEYGNRAINPKRLQDFLDALELNTNDADRIRIVCAASKPAIKEHNRMKSVKDSHIGRTIPMHQFRQAAGAETLTTTKSSPDRHQP